MKKIALSTKSFEHAIQSFLLKRIANPPDHRKENFGNIYDINSEQFEEVIKKLINTYKRSPYKRWSRGGYDSAFVIEVLDSKKVPVKIKIGYVFSKDNSKLYFKYTFRYLNMNHFKMICQLIVFIKQ
jgi:hypothetical protein